MFYIPFWVLMAFFAVCALVSIKLRGFTFADFQLIVMIVAVSLIIDMVLCKWLDYYSYVTFDKMKAFYSLIFCVIGYPAIGLIFIKFLPSSGVKVVFYILVSSAVLTVIEILVAPFEIILYEKWVIVPWSPLIYILSYTWIYGYYRVLGRYLPGRYSVR